MNENVVSIFEDCLANVLFIRFILFTCFKTHYYTVNNII